MTTMPQESGARAFWERTLTGWHIAFYVALALATVFVLTDPDLTATDRLAAVGIAALMAVSYTVLGRQVLGAERLDVPVACYLLSVWLPFLASSACPLAPFCCSSSCCRRPGPFSRPVRPWFGLF